MGKLLIEETQLRRLFIIYLFLIDYSSTDLFSNVTLIKEEFK